jgi:hypothetical protein
MADDDRDDLDWHGFLERQEPTVLTGISEFCNAGKHDECIGHRTMRDR